MRTCSQSVCKYVPPPARQAACPGLWASGNYLARSVLLASTPQDGALRETQVWNQGRHGVFLKRQTQEAWRSGWSQPTLWGQEKEEPFLNLFPPNICLANFL